MAERRNRFPDFSLSTKTLQFSQNKAVTVLRVSVRRIWNYWNELLILLSRDGHVYDVISLTEIDI